MRVKLKMSLGIGIEVATRKREVEIYVDDDMSPIDLQVLAMDLLDEWAANYVETDVQIEAVQP